MLFNSCLSAATCFHLLKLPEGTAKLQLNGDNFIPNLIFSTVLDSSHLNELNLKSIASNSDIPSRPCCCYCKNSALCKSLFGKRFNLYKISMHFSSRKSCSIWLNHDCFKPIESFIILILICVVHS